MSVRAATTILYVEDDDDNFQLMKRVLESTGRYKVARAEDGQIGLEMARQLRPALILLDLNLPIMSGLEVAAALRDDNTLGPVPIVAVSANVMNNERSLARAAGIDTFVEKPIDIVEIQRLVDRLAGH